MVESDKTKIDTIRIPGYYKLGNTDLISFMASGLLTDDEVRGFLKGNVFKYLTRYRRKSGVNDLIKASQYLDRLIIFENLKGNQAAKEKAKEASVNVGL